MSEQRSVSRSAAGKLFIAGEYAVLEPGHPALLVAVDRQVTVTVSEHAGSDVVIDADISSGEVCLRWLDGGLDGPGAVSLGPVVSAVEVVAGLLAERGLRPAPVHVAIRSDLHHGGTKLGLGSSGAVTVATVAAVAAYHRLVLSRETLFRLALLATARRDARASGGDLAASVWGGWIAYHAPDRQAVLDLAGRRGIEATIRAPWPGYAVRALPAPRRLALEVGWTGQPVSSAALTERLGTPRPGFVSRSDECVHAAIRALQQGDDHELLRRIRGAREVLAALDEEAGLGIFTPRLTALCDAAEAVGGAGKPSGAGGGDCGIALLGPRAQDGVRQLREKWAAAGVLPVPIRVQPSRESAP
ncbi:phosphomevalonate kinase [Actinoplanes aureus]|uniref:phosphomevalonate kinase n=1 Tax=Actinoplanes aureus TaxID=2792083 RepID=A0A931CAS5_9ACTN|nr:phosphomevalonate kinase [Actinoplanes aureus]MBG0566540.1 phosphomevalonate kinase [Actinoplanes aureus]